jgi:hypothetical protein
VCDSVHRSSLRAGTSSSVLPAPRGQVG